MLLYDRLTSVSYALDWLAFHKIPVPLPLMVQARKAGIAAKADIPTNYKDVRDEYWATAYDAVQNYLDGSQGMTAARNAFKRAMVEAFNDAGDIGFVDGGSALPLDDDAQAWLAARQTAERGFIDGLFQQLKKLKGEEDIDIIAEAFARADGYAATLDAVYSQMKLYGAKNKMLTFDGTDGDAAHVCQSINGTCVRLKGQRHKASWWISHDLIPRPGNSNFDCGGWRCGHFLRTDDGERFTV